MSRALLMLLIVMSADGPGDDPNPPSSDEQFRILRDAHQAAFDEFVRLNKEAKTPEDEEKVLTHPGRQPRRYAGGFMDLAKKYPRTNAVEDALLWICTHTFQTPTCEEAKRLLLRDHIRSAKLGSALGFQGHYDAGIDGCDVFFREVLAKSPHRDIQGLATYWLARHLSLKADCARAAKKPDFKKREGAVVGYSETYGQDWADRLRLLDPDALDREAESLFERVTRYYADVPHNDKRRLPGPLGEAAVAYLHEHRDLAIGKPALEFEGTDLDGRPFRLADVRGKVVVLDFGSHFYCGVCRDTYPQLREMTKRLEGRNFALISVNAEPEKLASELKDAWKADGNTWRCLFDGNWEGPIQKAWNIQRFPTIYVLDAKGVIRHKDLVGKELDEAVDKLIAEASGQ